MITLAGLVMFGVGFVLVVVAWKLLQFIKYAIPTQARIDMDGPAYTETSAYAAGLNAI